MCGGGGGGEGCENTRHRETFLARTLTLGNKVIVASIYVRTCAHAFVCVCVRVVCVCVHMHVCVCILL